ncbi:MAG: DUF3667 domain-containing protein [Flavobacterium sp.]|nr:DUF3667 domain-containing protein [Flavobacterium sp.]
MKYQTCLNCSETVSKNFCPECGQKTHTHRLEMKHFILHDLVHGVWHFDKGIWFTLKETFVRPGQAAVDYINGKRIRYYNVFYLSLLAIGLNILLSNYADKFDTSVDVVGGNEEKIINFMDTYAKILLLGIVPIIALNAKLFFKRLHYNLAEHFIIAGICLLGALIINLLYLVFFLVDLIHPNALYVYLEGISLVLLFAFPSYVFFGITRTTYRFFGYFWRMIVFNIFVILQLLFVLRLIVLVLTGKFTFYGLI